ncbi:cell 12A endoglucanase [Phytophthora cinnamomi]|uniref:cell 12A endoglucanase n=1 Tax=Phytophthora cinnamomi TaxID=4785 RepID=UPI00355A52C6|nr:cell 12A endoglucanase [Phytophthora cinnamomi]
MKFLLVAAAFAASAVSADKMCGDWDTAVVGDFTLYNNLWGKDNDPGTGHQCTTLLNSSADNSTLVWSTEYKWGGITWNVKGYPNVGLHFKPIELANVDSIPTSINYTYEYTPTTTANVAYDLFTSSTPDGDFEYEIMVWLAAIGTAWPLASEGKNIKNITVSGVDFMLNHGVNGNMTVFSYVAAQLTKNFTGDLTEFIEALPQDVAPDAKQYLTKVQCGTESYHADNASMTVTSYTVAVNTLMQGDVGFSQN